MSDFKYYQNRVLKYATHKHKLYPFLKLSSEVGSVNNAIAASLQRLGYLDTDGIMDSKTRLSLLLSLGEILHTVSQCCTELDACLEDVAYRSVEKLEDADRKASILPTGGSDDRVK